MAENPKRPANEKPKPIGGGAAVSSSADNLRPMETVVPGSRDDQTLVPPSKTQRPEETLIPPSKAPRSDETLVPAARAPRSDETMVPAAKTARGDETMVPGSGTASSGS